MKKKVSLLMMTYNSFEDFKQTLLSVEQQDYPNIELVISDGGSKDGTVEFIQEYEKKSNLEVNFVSEADEGLYDALNKDIQRASGDYLLVFNDKFVDSSAISKLVRALENERADGAHGDLVYTENGKIMRAWKMGNGKIISGWLPGHPTMMLKKEVYDTYGLYDISYDIAADYEFMTRIFKDGTIKLAYVPEILVDMYYGGTSSYGIKSYVRSFMESAHGLKKNGYHFPFIIVAIRTVRTLLQFVNKKNAASELKKIENRKKSCG